MALLARDGRRGGSAFITLPAGIRERLCERAQARRPSRRGARLIVPEHTLHSGIKGRVRFLIDQRPRVHQIRVQALKERFSGDGAPGLGGGSPRAIASGCEPEKHVNGSGGGR